MIIHATRKLAARLPDVSSDALQEDSPLGSWHADRVIIDRRQCVIFCHDETRAALFVPGLRKELFADLGARSFRPLFSATLAALGCPPCQASKAELALGPIRFDTATDRSVLSSIRIVRQDLEGHIARVPNVLMLDPVAVAVDLCDRPASVRGKWIWPNQRLLELVSMISTRH
ncbi:MAG: hypothetical protein Q8N51_03945 [Gammaproteobacteria bacterium]|nr:hypothetical protein [Gammaproteobacteria bacterium]